MLDKRKRRAAALLFEHTDDEAARMLKVGRRTLEAWKRDPEFAQALCDFVRENRLAAVRFISMRVVEASRELEAMIRSGDEKVRHKVIIDLLKASGLLAADHAEGGESEGFSAILRRISEVPDETGEED